MDNGGDRDTAGACWRIPAQAGDQTSGWRQAWVFEKVLPKLPCCSIPWGPGVHSKQQR